MNVTNARDLVNIAMTAALSLENDVVHWVLGRLTRVSDVAFSSKVETACIRMLGDEYRIEFSPEFVKKQLESPEDILFVLLHEIHHKLRGDFFRDLACSASSTERRLANVVEDIRINAHLCNEYFPRCVGLLEKLYAKGSFPGILLAPPPVVIRNNAEKLGCPDLGQVDAMQDVEQVPRYELESFMARVMETYGRQGDEAGKIAEWYVDAWLEDCTVQGLVDRLMELLGREILEIEIILLGDHSGRKTRLPKFAGALDDPFYRYTAGEGDELEEDCINPVMQSRQAEKLHREIRKALAPDPKNPRDAVLFVPERSVFPPGGRRESFLLSCGVWPVFFENTVLQVTKDFCRVHMYIDVSGSTSEIQPFLYGLVRHLGDLAGEPVYLFSNQVAEISLGDLEGGVRRSTGGTDFDCVIEHAVKNRFGKVLMITDGMADMREENKERVRKGEVDLYVLITNEYHHRGLDGLAKRIWRLDKPQSGLQGAGRWFGRRRRRRKR